MKKSLLALLVSAAAASGAHAAWDSGSVTNGLQGNGIGNGEALLFLYDATTKNSYVQDLNVNFENLKSGAAFNGQSVALSSSALSVFGGNYSNVQWGVVVYGGTYLNSDASAPLSSKYGYALTTPSTLASIDVSDLPGVVGTIGQKFNEAQTSGYAFTGLASSTVQTATAGGNGYAGADWFAGYLSNYGLGLGANGQTLNLAFEGFADDEFSVARQGSLGQLTLNLAGGNGALAFSGSAPAVPVPAAAWLMGSALFGLGGVARARKNRA